MFNPHVPNVTPIPDDRPVYGKDITQLAESFGFTTLDTSYLMGLYMSLLAELTSTTLSDKDIKNGHDKPGAERPIEDPRKALLLRLLSRHPQYCPIMPGTTPGDVFLDLQFIPGRLGFRSGDFGVMMGSELSATYRWWQGSGVSPITARYLGIIKAMLQTLPEEARGDMLDELTHLAEVEAASRGIDPKDLWRKGSWRRAGRRGQAGHGGDGLDTGDDASDEA